MQTTMICFRRVETRMFQPCRIVRAMAATNPYQMGWPTIRFRHVSWNLFAQCRATALDTTRLQWPSFDLVHSIRPRPGVSRKPGRDSGWWVWYQLGVAKRWSSGMAGQQSSRLRCSRVSWFGRLRWSVWRIVVSGFVCGSAGWLWEFV